MTVTVSKMTFQKLKPKIINYRDYKFFYNVRYKNDLRQEISNSYLEFNDNGFSGFFIYIPNYFRSACTSKEEVSERQSYAIY